MVLSSPSDLAAIWRSDAAAQARRPVSADREAALTDLAARLRPTAGAHERTLAVPEPFAGILPNLARDAVVSIQGAPGAGATSLAFGLAAAATHAGEWAAAVDIDGTFGVEAARGCGVALDRFVVARNISEDRWSTVVAALLDGTTCVLAQVPPKLHASQARRLVAKARERAAALVVVGAWPADAAWRIEVEATDWSNFGPDAPFLDGERTLTVHVEGRAIAPGRRAIPLAS